MGAGRDGIHAISTLKRGDQGILARSKWAAVPEGDVWLGVHEYYQMAGHIQQLRQMLASLADEA